ncbi:MAG: NAD/NADP octopine/nopaline dehydrogenase family protein [Muribaculaceae bacterium]|nr:NAD/NADP octopine/nopaline dehydrogenase family protein [Muribaculaceae bacterium]
MKRQPTICICGGGSLGLVCAGVFLSQGYAVNLLTGHPQNWSHSIKVLDPDGKLYQGNLNNISCHAEDVVSEADIVLLCVPGYLIEQTLNNISPHLRPTTLVGSVVSSTGFFFIAHKILTGNPLFGFQRVPFIARQREYGKIGDLLGYKPHLNAVIEMSNNPERDRKLLEALFLTPVSLLDNFYEVALTNSNPILHTGRLYALWGNNIIEPAETQVLFYSDWTNEASEYLISMDNEFQTLLRALGIKESSIPRLLTYYESRDAQSLTDKIKSIQAFKAITAPMIQTKEGWIPDYKSRYFTEDFPFGLKYIRDLAKTHSIDCPTIDRVFEWGMSKINHT